MSECKVRLSVRSSATSDSALQSCSNHWQSHVRACACQHTDDQQRFLCCRQIPISHQIKSDQENFQAIPIDAENFDLENNRCVKIHAICFNSCLVHKTTRNTTSPTITLAVDIQYNNYNSATGIK